MESEHMGVNDLTDKEKEIIRVLAKKGHKTYYELYFPKQENIASSSTVWKALKRLKSEEKGLIEVKKTTLFERIKSIRKKHYGLTFKGILYAVHTKLIKPSEAEKARVRNDAKIPVTDETHKALIEMMSNNKAKERFEDMAIHQKRQGTIPVNTFTEPYHLARDVLHDHSAKIYSFIVRHTNLNFYDENTVANLLMLALVQATFRSFSKYMRRYKVMPFMMKAGKKLMEGILDSYGKELKKNSKRR